MTNPNTISGLKALAAFVRKIPDEKLDMREACGERACILSHAAGAGYNTPDAHYIGSATYIRLFDFRSARNRRDSTYPDPTGAAAKKEFLRRLAVIIRRKQLARKS